MSTMIDILQGCNRKYFKSGDFPWNKGTSINTSSTTDKRQAPPGKSSKFFC